MTRKVGKADEKQEPIDQEATAKEEGEPIQVVDRRRFARVSEANEESNASVTEEDSTRYPSYVEELQSRLKQAEEQVERLQTRFKQAQTDLEREADELRSRLQRNAESRLEMAKGEIFQRMIEVADNLERAILSAETAADNSTLLEGVKATHA